MDLRLVALLLLFLLFLLLLLLLFLQSRENKRKNELTGFSDSDLEELRNFKEEQNQRQAQTKKSQILDVLRNADPLILAQLSKQSGMSTEQLKDRSNEGELVTQIARRLSLEDVQSLHIAVTTKDIKSTTATVSAMEKTPIPTNDMRPESLTSLDQLTSLTPEATSMDDLSFYQALVTQELPVLQSYENVTKRGLKAMLLDVSSSMEESTRGGLSKCVVARGATYKLISDSSTYHTDFLLRFFDGGSHPLMKASSEEEKIKMMEVVRNQGFSGGGTNILGAIMEMAQDINTLPGITEADITLISDGQDSACSDIELLRKILGPIKLHVIAIGEENQILKKIATSYTYLS